MRPPLRDRKFADSSLERNGIRTFSSALQIGNGFVDSFELGPSTGAPVIRAIAGLGIRIDCRAAVRGAGGIAEPKVRIRSPPAASLRTFGPGAAGDRCKVRLDAGEGASAWPGGNWRFAGTSRLKSLVLPALTFWRLSPPTTSVAKAKPKRFAESGRCHDLGADAYRSPIKRGGPGSMPRSIPLLSAIEEGTPMRAVRQTSAAP